MTDCYAIFYGIIAWDGASSVLQCIQNKIMGLIRRDISRDKSVETEA